MHNRNIKSIIFLIGFLLLFFHFSSNLYSQETKIRIIEPDAVVRLKPNQESIVIIKAPLGSILTVVELRDEWFKVKLLPDKDGDVLKIPVEINESWVGKGMNIGGGIDFIFAKNVALTLGARYYYCPSIELKWEYSTGNYDGLYGSYRWTINKDYTNAYEKATSVLTVDPSFTMLSCGLKFMF